MGTLRGTLHVLYAPKRIACVVVNARYQGWEQLMYIGD